MTLAELVLRYVHRTEKVFEDLKIVPYPSCKNKREIEETIDEAKRYLEDAKYYLANEKYDTGLASVAYCEGLLDALRMLNFVEFSW